MILRSNRSYYRRYIAFAGNKDVPGMISPNERAFLEFYAKSLYSGKGEIVDLGTWFGASSYALARGLSSNRNVTEKKKRIHAYDPFYWEASLDPHVAGTRFEGLLSPGDDYQHVFNEFLQPYSEFIVATGDISKHGWTGKPIEFLFIDAMKNPWVTIDILKFFYPYLIPGKSLVVYQDFDHYLTPWIHLLIYRYRDYFDFVHYIPPSGSIIFRLRKAIPTEMLGIDLAAIGTKEADCAFRYCLKLAVNEKRRNIMAAHVMFYHYHQLKIQACSLFEQYTRKTDSKGSDLEDVKKIIYA